MAANAKPSWPPFSRRLAVAGAAALVFLAGMAARGTLGHQGAPPPVTAVSAGTGGPGPSRTVDGAPAGFSPDEAGAKAAAVAFTATMSQRLLYVGPATADTAVRAMAAAGSADTLAADVLAKLAAATGPLAAGTGPTWWAVWPLAVKVDAYGGDRARVSVWLARFLSRQGVVVPQASWATDTVELVWERGDWRLWSTVSVPGPTPVLDGSALPVTAAGLDRALAGFELYGRPEAAGR